MSMKRFYIISIISFFITISPLLAQSPVPLTKDNPIDPTPSPTPSLWTAGTFKSFRGIQIGMPIEQVKDLLKKDSYFNYRGDPDVYFLPAREQTLIECSGNSFIKRAYFQFVDRKLFAMILDLYEDKVDFYTLLSSFQEKYGPYVSFTPLAVTWEKNNVRLSLEKPLTVKYIDIAVFNRLKEAGIAGHTEEEKVLKDFLEEF
jgi:hypothetical protein